MVYLLEFACQDYVAPNTIENHVNSLVMWLSEAAQESQVGIWPKSTGVFLVKGI